MSTMLLWIYTLGVAVHMPGLVHSLAVEREVQKTVQPPGPTVFMLIHEGGIIDRGCNTVPATRLTDVSSVEECANQITTVATAFHWYHSGPHQGNCFVDTYDISSMWDGWMSTLLAGNNVTACSLTGAGFFAEPNANTYAWGPTGATALPTPAPPTPVFTTKATGDPHLVNIRGQHFDVLQPGVHTLLQIPQMASSRNTVLRVEATAAQVGGRCADMYFEAMNITGKWVDEEEGMPHHHGGFQVSVYEPTAPQDMEWRLFGPVKLRVARGHTKDGVNYLNLYMKHLKQVKYPIGGILGDDDYSAVSTPSVDCIRSVNLASGTPKIELPEESM